MEVYGAEYEKWYGSHDCDHYSCVAVGTTKSEAFGFVLEMFPDTLSDNWTLTPVDITTAGVYLED